MLTSCSGQIPVQRPDPRPQPCRCTPGPRRQGEGEFFVVREDDACLATRGKENGARALGASVYSHKIGIQLDLRTHVDYERVLRKLYEVANYSLRLK